jgi:hypothetical protein
MAIKDRPDLIVSDVMMPKISGFDMLDILRSTTETKTIKVIMMTALSSEDQRQRGVALGADRYLVKSQVGIEDVVRTVHEVLGDAPIASFGSPSATPAPAPAPAPIPQPAAAAAPTPVPVMPAPAPVAPMPQPVPQPSIAPPAPTAPIAPLPVAPPLPAPAPIPQPAPIPAPAPVSAPTVPPPAPAATLPQPSAPFSTPRNTLAGRVIEPLSQSESDSGPNFEHMMNQELAQASPNPFAEKPAVTPGSQDTNIPPAPPSAIAMPALPTAPTGLDFEETPHPTGAIPTLPPAPQPPNTGL